MRHVAGLVMFMLSFGAVVPQELAAEIEGIQLQVDGLSCPFCAIGLDKRLKQRAGLENIQIHMKQGLTEASLPQGKGIDVKNVKQAIQEAGFTLRGIKLTVVGTVARDDGYFAITSRGDGTRFLLFDAEHRDVVSGVALSTALQQQLERAKQTKTLVRVDGGVHEHAGLPPALMIESMTEVRE